MNNEMFDRLRRFGDTVDQAAVAAGAPAGPLRDVSDPLARVDDLTEDGDDLEPVVPLRGRRDRRYRAIVAAAAALIVVIGGAIVTARITGSPDSGAADSTDVIGSNPTTTEPNVMASTTTAVVVPVVPPESTSTPTTSTSSSTTTTPPPYSPVCPTYRANTTLPIRQCDKGAAVLVIQQHLGVNADGYFGPATRDAVRQFQRDQGLEVDGLVGPATWSLLVPDAGVPGT